MTKWLLKVLLSLTLTFILFQGYSRESSEPRQHTSCFTQLSSFHKPVISAKLQLSDDKQSLDKQNVSSHRKGRAFQKLFADDNDDDDDDCDELPSYKKYLTDNCFYPGYSAANIFLYYVKDRLPRGHHLSVLLSDRHLILCTLRI